MAKSPNTTPISSMFVQWSQPYVNMQGFFVPKEQSERTTQEEQKQIDEWLKTNEVKVYAPGERTSDDNIAYTHGWGKKKKKAQPKKVDK